MHCPSCGKENDFQNKYCDSCGHNLFGMDMSQSEYGEYVEQEVFDYAGFWKRAVATGLDMMVMLIVHFTSQFIAGFAVFYVVKLINDSYYQANIIGHIWQYKIIYYALSLLLAWLYFALMESSENQATFGKIALGIIVTDLKGERISFGKASKRFLWKLISMAILFIGCFMVKFTTKKQALHDIMAGSLVVEEEDYKGFFI